MTFGRYLLRHGIVSEEQLEDATAAMVLFGGRLGTHLVEQGTLAPDELEPYLAAHLDVIAAPAERLEKPCEKALASLPEALVQRHKVFPFGLEAGRLEVAMRDPQDRTLCTELARASRLRIAPFLTSEIRLFFLLEKHFGIQRNQRYARLGGAARPEELPVLLLDDVIENGKENGKEDGGRGWAPLGDGEELIDAASFAALYQEPEARPRCAPIGARTTDARPTEKAWLVAGDASVAALEAGLEQARDRDAIVSHALAIALGHARAVALFAVRGTAQGLAAAGEVDRSDLRGLLVAPEAGSLLAAAIEGGEPARGAPRADGIDGRLARLLRRVEPAELAFFPVRIGERVVNLLYADNGPEPLAATSCAALSALCQRVASSYERIILERKQRLC